MSGQKKYNDPKPVLNMLAIKLKRLAAEAIAVADAIQASQTVEVIQPGVKYNRSSRMLIINGKNVRPQAGDGRVLEALLDHRGTVLSRDELTSLLFGAAALGVRSRAIDTHVNTLRHMGVTAIVTRHKWGYMLP